MRSVEEDKGCYNHGSTAEISTNSTPSFEFHKGNNGANIRNHRTALGKPTPSKWDDAQKWLVGLSRVGEKSQSKTKPRNSNADDLRLIAPVPQKEQDYYSSGEEEKGEKEGQNGYSVSEITDQYGVETKKVDESVWRSGGKASDQSSTAAVRSICVRDMGTEMTPAASLEPSRTATPIRATTPAARSPVASGSSTPVRCQNGKQNDGFQIDSRGEANDCKRSENKNLDQGKKMCPLESRAMAWDEAERAKYMARYKREEVKIQAWENHEKRKAEMAMRKMEVKAERLKARAQERLTNKLAATRRIAEEKRANAEAELNEKAAKTSETADYIRRTGHLPYTFSFKLPSLCW